MKLKDGQKINGILLQMMQEFSSAKRQSDADYPELPVIQIDGTKLMKCVLKPLTTTYRIPDEVTEISTDAFWQYDAGLPDDTDYLSLLDTVYIPKNVRVIEANAFNGLHFLTQLIVDDDNPYFTSMDGIVYSKDKKKLVVCPPGKTYDQFRIPDSVEIIGENAFSNSIIIRIEVGESVVELENNAFSDSMTEEVDFSKAKLKKVGELVFDYVYDMTIIAGSNRFGEELFGEESEYTIK